MGGRIDCYLDIASFFSFVAFADLCQNLDKLKAHGVQVEFHPTLIGGINNLSGNKPPWLLPAKAKYLSVDSLRAATRVGLSHVRSPKDLMSMAHTVSPLRALHYVKANYPTEVYLATFETLFNKFWTPPHVNLKEDDNLRAALRDATNAKGEKLFGEADVENIMKGREQHKDKLKDTTQKAVDLGAFGAPWIWVTNTEGKAEAFFGSDRFNHIYKHLGVPFQDVAVLPASKL